MTEPREQLLISRVIDGDVADGEWRELETLGQANPLVWRELALAMKDHQDLSRAVNASVAVADYVNMPNSHQHRSLQPLRLAGSWGGWLAAAVIGIFAVLHFTNTSRVTNAPNTGANIQQAGFIPVSTADEAWNAYLAKGRESGAVVGEVPAKVLIESRPAPSGEGYELLYLRQVIERTIVPDLYQFTGQDESGRPTPVRYQPATGGAL